MLERNDLERSIYMNQFADLVSDPAMCMFIDEAARNKKNPSCKMGWSLKGLRAAQRQCFVRGQRFSILPVLTLDGIVAYDIYPGSITSELFAKFLREHIVCPTVQIMPCIQLIVTSRYLSQIPILALEVS
jgi:hypothetical protein